MDGRRNLPTVRVLQNGRVLARLSSIQHRDDRLTAIWNGTDPPFEPSEQVEPLVLESEDGLERRDAWLLRVVRSEHEPLRVEIGSERNAPAWRQSTPPPQRQSSPPGDARLHPTAGHDILVVDDDPDTLELVGRSLEEQGWTVRRAPSGREAIARAMEQPPDVAVVDLIMPEVGGEQVCATLRRDSRFSHTRVLVLSGAEDTRLVAASCDADSAVTKPFTVDVLVREVRRLLRS